MIFKYILNDLKNKILVEKKLFVYGLFHYLKKFKNLQKLCPLLALKNYSIFSYVLIL